MTDARRAPAVHAAQAGPGQGARAGRPPDTITPGGPGPDYDTAVPPAFRRLPGRRIDLAPGSRAPEANPSDWNPGALRVVRVTSKFMH